MIAPLKRGHLIAIGSVLLFSLLIFANTFLETPYQPSLTLLSKSTTPIWLIATMSPANNPQRRAIIRSTWQTLYKNTSLFTTRFVISNPGPLWLPIIEVENATYGDIIMLPDLEEKATVANTIKSVEFFKYITSSPNRWDFVSKLDDDSYLDAHTFYETYLHPRLVFDQKKAVDTPSAVDRTIFGRTLHHGSFTYPGGQFYTMGWDMISLLASLYSQNPISNEDEDVLVGRLLYEAGEQWEHIDLPNEVAFDYEGKRLAVKGEAFARKGADLSGWKHAVGPGAMNPHKMREDEDYLRVAACFGKDGVMEGQFG